MNDSTQNYLHDNYVAQLQRSFVSCLDRVGKGWFNIHESNQQTYEFSKLKRLLSVARFMMEDTTRTLVLSGLRAFERFTIGVCDVEISVEATDRVIVTPGPRARKLPLLAVELQLGADLKKVQYLEDVGQLPDQMVALMMRAISASQGLSQLEPLIMTKLSWAYKPKLATVMAGEEEVVRLRDSVRKSWETVVTPLMAYCALFSRFVPILERNNEAHVKAMLARGGNLSFDDVLKALRDEEVALEDILASIPLKVVCSQLFGSIGHVQNS
jgi:dynein heavy chain, axonemal